jgi:hypothetical protein
MSLNVSAMALLHITDIPLFPGYASFGAVVDQVIVVARRLSRALPRVHSGVAEIVKEDLRPEWIRVPLDYGSA